jgi:hypothetical protein
MSPRPERAVSGATAGPALAAIAELTSQEDTDVRRIPPLPGHP